MKYAALVLAGLGLGACSSSGLNVPGIGTIALPAPLTAKAIDGQILQCSSIGGSEALIDYPDNWASRVSRAETEDELLGGPAQNVATSGDAEPLAAVSYTYPPAAFAELAEGICEVKFDLSRRGVPSRVTAACSDPVFIDEATRAVSRAKFKPVRVNGAIARGVNVTYPLMFCVPDEDKEAGA